MGLGDQGKVGFYKCHNFHYVPFALQLRPFRPYQLLLSFCLVNELPVRGAIGYGRFCLMDNMLMGPAVDEVASWYEAVEWLGAVFTPTASFRYRPEDFGAVNLIDYDVPLKRGGAIR